MRARKLDMLKSPVMPASTPGANDFAAKSGFHQVEALLEFVDVDLVGEHFLQGKPAQHHLRHLVPGLIHATAIDALDGQALEDDLVPVDSGALGQDAEQEILPP